MMPFCPEFSFPSIESSPPDHKTEKQPLYRVSKKNCRLCNHIEVPSVVSLIMSNKTSECFFLFSRDEIRKSADTAKLKLTNSIVKHIKSSKLEDADVHGVHEQQFKIEEDLEECIYLEGYTVYARSQSCPLKNSEYVMPAEVIGKPEAPIVTAWLKVVDIAAHALVVNKGKNRHTSIAKSLTKEAYAAEEHAADLHGSLVNVEI